MPIDAVSVALGALWRNRGLYTNIESQDEYESLPSYVTEHTRTIDPINLKTA